MNDLDDYKLLYRSEQRVVYKRNGEIARLSAEGALKDALLQRCSVALNDWVNTYATELCNKEKVEETYKRIHDNNGTLAYIGQLISDIHSASGKQSDG